MKDNGRLNLALPLALAIGMAGLGAAEAQVSVGGKPDVMVDPTVLDQLGPPSDLPALFLNQPPPAARAERIVLVPPKSMRAGHRPPHEEVSGIHLHPLRHHAHSGEHKAAKVEKLESHPAASAAEPAAAKAPEKSAATAPLTPTLQSSPPPAAEAPAQTPATAPPAQTPAATAPSQAPTALQPQPLPPSAALTSQPPPATTQAAPTQAGQETIGFDKESARLPEGARDTLAHLASKMAEDGGLEVQLLAYAAGNEENASKARRLSLSRALAVRGFLIDQGVRSTRIEVRALGNKVPEGPPDRVDIVLQKRG